MMNTFISGERQYDFVSKFNYVREAGTVSYTHLDVYKRQRT